jgi:FSR family fosmidomycin resistance protein-like MFS transporter
MPSSNIEYSSARSTAHALRRLTFTLLIVEFLDEIVDGTLRAAWPFIRHDLNLSYAEIGLLISLPGILANFLIEPVVGILADIWRRRALILGGGIVFAAALMLAAFSGGFAPLFVAFALLFPASGAFVNISQVVLMDLKPERREQFMARWTFAGSVGNVAGPLALGLFIAAGLGGWRGLFTAIAASTLLTVFILSRSSFTEPSREEGRTGFASLLGGIRVALGSLGRREVLRWLALLELADFMQRGLQSYLALYFVDVAGLSETRAGLALVVWMGAVLPGDLLLIPLLERVRGLSYLRWSAAATLTFFILFLVVPGVSFKLASLGLMGFTSAGWYAILKAQLYAEMPGRSGTVMTLGNVFGLIGDLVPLGFGIFAGAFGLQAAMWLLTASPLALLLMTPRRQRSLE